jgi:hypothetical protein
MQTIAEKIDAAFPRSIIKMPLYGPDNIASPHYGLCFEDATGKDDWCRCTVKKGYQPHTTNDVKELCLAVAEGFDLSPEHIDVQASWTKGKGHAVSVVPTKEYRRDISRGKQQDNVWPSLIVRAYYGGAFRATVAMKRDLCSNLMMIRNLDKCTVNLRHSTNFRDMFDDSVDQFRKLIAMSDSVVEACRMLADYQVNLHEFLDAHYHADSQTSKRSATIRENKLSKIKQIVRDEKQKLQTTSMSGAEKASLWDIVNGITGYVQHHKTRHGKVNADDRALTAALDRESDAAWSSAFYVAKNTYNVDLAQFGIAV